MKLELLGPEWTTSTSWSSRGQYIPEEYSPERPVIVVEHHGDTLIRVSNYSEDEGKLRIKSLSSANATPVHMYAELLWSKF